MKQVLINGKKESAIIQGCMRIADKSQKEVEAIIKTDLDNGISFFDHADIYGDGRCEENFGKVLKANPSLRDKITLQSKCGIKMHGIKEFNSTCEHVVKSVDGILKRLQTDHLDYLAIHRADALVEPEELAKAFDTLKSQGKVLNFGVSNHNSMQIELYKKFIKQPIVINQMQMSLMHTGMVDQGLTVNNYIDGAICRDGLILDYCRLNDITIQCWSPFFAGFFEDVFVDNPKFPKVNECLQKYATKYGVTKNAIAVAWLLRHPANMQVIIGTTTPSRIIASAKAQDFTLTHEEWYDLYASTGNPVL